MTLPFPLPIPEGHFDAPRWDGSAFVCGNQRLSVLEYSENFAGWSDDLTSLHEESAGDCHPMDLASRHDALQQVKNFMPSANAVVVEIGCSSGFLLRDLASTFPASVLIGVDVVKEPLYRLAKSLLGVPLIRFDLLQCPLPEQSVDIVIMLNVLEHIEDDAAALLNVFRLLKPGGYLIIEVPAGSYLYDSYDAELKHFRRYSVIELKRKLKVVGFRVLRQSHLGFIVYPAFVVVKLLNKWLRPRRKSEIVSDHAARTSGSLLVKYAMKVESKHLTKFSLPFGVRALAVARRPK